MQVQVQAQEEKGEEAARLGCQVHVRCTWDSMTRVVGVQQQRGEAFLRRALTVGGVVGRRGTVGRSAQYATERQTATTQTPVRRRLQ